MTDWMMWLTMAGVLVILEMFSGTFYLLMVAVGFSAGALAALAGLTNPAQMAITAVVGIVATYALRRSKYGRRNKLAAARDPNVNLDVGQTLRIEHWNQQHVPATARTQYRGAMWDIELAPGAEAHAGSFIIREIRGSRLIVSNQISNSN
ncbi:MAG TPA: NfeD family protein [Burkholderiaceae bacterium]|nr:NfeD family protein [Burkholderiaceae bacterium]